MTAEIIIMNKKAVAIAADSAATTMGGKVFTSENKIFQLSRYEPVAIMIWDSSYFMGVPFEVLIKKYRKEVLNTKTFDDIEKYSIHFLEYLNESNDFSSAVQEKEYIRNQITAYYDFLEKKGRTISHYKEIRGEKAEIVDILNKIIDDDNNNFSKLENLKAINQGVINKYKDIILQENKKIKEEIFNGMKIKEEKLAENAISIFIKAGLCDYPYKLKTGIAIVGYGNSNIFPSFFSFLIYGVLGNVLLYEESIKSEIDYTKKADIQAFAQSDMIYSFLFGVHPYFYNEVLEAISIIINILPKSLIESLEELSDDEKIKYLDRLSDESAKKEYLKAVYEHLYERSWDKYYKPLLNIVEILPKDELANMAEVLINLTSFKKRISFEAETVGGPIDVAVLSKGDGFIWVKRKHYFSRELNQQYFVNYERGYKNVQRREKKRGNP